MSKGHAKLEMRERYREEVRESSGNRRKEDGGWIPVIKNHWAQMGDKSRSKEIFTLFVDNIPEGKDQQ